MRQEQSDPDTPDGERPVLVREYASDDAPACRRVINDAVADMEGLNVPALALIQASNTTDQLSADLESWITLVCEIPDLGVVAVGALDGVEVKRVYVDPRAQGNGIGRALVGALEERASELGIAEVCLDASPSSVSFFEDLDYTAGQQESLSVGEAVFRFVKMTKRLIVD